MPTNCPQCSKPVTAAQQFCTNCGTSLVRGGVSSNAPTQIAATIPPPPVKPAAPGDPLIGRVLEGKYELFALLGTGGMGAVYRARRVHIGDEVAVKILHPQYLAQPAAVERFRREARAAAMLQHPNIVAIYDYAEARGAEQPAFIVMELVKGISLRALLQREKRLPARRAVALMREICAGVGAAHRHHVVHRDLKPDNVIVMPPRDDDDERESVKVLDFGIAKLRDLAPEQSLTQTGAVIGTPYYMSPEQCRGDALDARSDVYSLGAMLFELITGQPPFTAHTITGVVAKHLTEPPPSLRSFVQVPAALEAAVMRTLAKDAQARQADATALARELQSTLSPAVPPPNFATNVVPQPARPIPPTEVVPPPATAPRFNPATAPPGYVPETVVTPPQFAAATPSSSRSGLIMALGGVALFVIVVAGVGLWLLDKQGRESNSQRRVTPPPTLAPKPTVAAAPTPEPTAAPVIASQTQRAAAAGEAFNLARIERAETAVVRGEELAAGDLAGLSPAELRVLRNTIFARHGRPFEAPGLLDHFKTRPWYATRDDYSDNLITDVDRRNVNLLSQLEAKARAAATMSAQASSSAESFSPDYTRDDRPDTAWVEGASGPGIGEWIAFTFKPQTIQYVEIFPGYGKSAELFAANHRVKRVTLVFSDGTRTQAALFDEMRRQTIALAAPVRSSSLRVIIEAVYRGSRYDDTVISEINWR